MRDLGKLIVAKGLKKLPKVQKIAQSGHTEWNLNTVGRTLTYTISGSITQTMAGLPRVLYLHSNGQTSKVDKLKEKV